MAYPYPSEQPGEFWVTYTRQVAALYERAGQPFPDAGGEAFRWFSRPAYDIGAGMEPEAARVKHLRGLEEGLGLVPPAPPIQRLHRSGRWLRREDGTRFLWQGVSGFGLLYRLRESEDDVVWYLDWARAQERNVVRVFTTAANLFDLSPDTGLSLLPRLCGLAAARGIYIEAVAIIDSAVRAYDTQGHLDRVRGMVETTPNLLVEGGNELMPLHETQSEAGRNRVWRYAGVTGGVYAQGSTHNGSDDSAVLGGGDYVPVHFDRSDGENGWRWVRHTKEGWDLSEATWKFVVNDEPRRDDLDRDRQFALGALCRICGLGDTFHYDGGRYWMLPTPEEQSALDERQHGWTLVGHHGLDDGNFKNAGWSDSPIKSFDTTAALRCYSRVNGGRGVTLVLGVTGDPQIEWQHGWSTYGAIVDRPTTRLLAIQR